MKLKKNAKYDLATVTSMGVRITPVDRQPVEISHNYYMQATSAETNVLNVSASLGLNTLAMTKFVKDHAIARFIQGELRRRNINYVGKEVEQDNPWGYRHQFNIADSGYGLRGPRVLNDRAGEVGRSISVKDYDLKKIFKTDGVKILHLSGLICAMSKDTTKTCLEVARFAKKNGTAISFDLNYRASFWKNREKELRKSFKEIASIADILIGNEEDFQLALGLKGPEAGGRDISSKIDGFKAMIKEVKAQYPNASIYATTLREVNNANEHMWGSILYDSKKWYVEQPREIQVPDRIGGGDGFVGGLLYGILKGFTTEKAMQFGWATGAMATTMLEDYASPVDESQVFAVYKGNARVKR